MVSICNWRISEVSWIIIGEAPRLLSKGEIQSLNHSGSYVKTISFKSGGFYTLEANRGDDEEKKLEPLKQWLRYLTDYHRNIPTILAKCTRLRGLTLRAEWYKFGLYTREDAANDDLYFCTLRTRGDDIQSATIRDIISYAHTHNITSLEQALRGGESVTSRNCGRGRLTAGTHFSISVPP